MSAIADPAIPALPAAVALPEGRVELFLWLRAVSDPRPVIDAALRAIAADRSAAAVTMLNLLAYRERAEYPDGARRRDVSGRAAYRRYGVVAARSVALLGGSIEHIGTLEGALGDPPGLATSWAWDELAIVRYPRLRSFVQLEQMPGYVRALVHRNAGLARTARIVTR